MLFTGCASIICGPDQKVNLESQPSGAEISVYDSRGEIVFQKTTPCTAKLSRRQHDFVQGGQYVVLAKKEGYSPVQFPLIGVVNRAYFANVMTVVGFAIDPVTGGMWTLVPETSENRVVNEQAGFFRDERLLISLPDENQPDQEPVMKAAQN